ncbi:MAG: sporulation protein YabP [Ruminococcaceae bacterium]|nr:sporulation protein YabP [Oscillospiraceae bacterium]
MDMTDEQQPHSLTLKNRKTLSITGATEVLSVEEEAVVVKTGLGTLVIQGRGLKIRTLSPEGGRVEVDGTVIAISYDEPKRTGGVMRRLFG